MAARLTLLKEARVQLGFSATKAVRLAREGHLPAVKIGGLWYVKDLDTWLDAQGTRTRTEKKVGHATARVAAGIEPFIPAQRQF
jgi:hypothetical protein